mmetsp:Transcript_73252/g.238254  ORF Transcript_73252/g.238254 Transcript_73252/m.238254 type:complete len:225 (+) Transcript_73252:645-1319(+)
MVRVSEKLPQPMPSYSACRVMRRNCFCWPVPQLLEQGPWSIQGVTKQLMPSQGRSLQDTFSALRSGQSAPPRCGSLRICRTSSTVPPPQDWEQGPVCAQSLIWQSTGHGSSLQFMSRSISEGHSTPPWDGSVRSVLISFSDPPPHMREQADMLFQSDTEQSTPLKKRYETLAISAADVGAYSFVGETSPERSRGAAQTSDESYMKIWKGEMASLKSLEGQVCCA